MIGTNHQNMGGLLLLYQQDTDFPSHLDGGSLIDTP